jgi:tetratricopeptide (TPR) repeat protein
VCKLCLGAALPIRVRRAVAQPFTAQMLLDAVRWPFHKEGFLTSAACAVVLALLGQGGLGGLFAFGLVLAVMFHVTTSTAKGEDQFSTPGDFRGFFEDIIGPVFRILVASVWAWAPTVAFVIWRGGGIFRDGNLMQPTGSGAAVVLLLLLAGTFLYPMALLAGALGAPLYYLLNPLVVIGYAIRLGRDYLLIALFCMAVSIAESILLGVLNFLDGNVVLLPNLAQYFALLFPPLMLFRAMGLLVRARGDELGYGGENSYLVPILGDRQPDAQLSPPAPPPLEQTESAPVEPRVPATGSGIELPHETDAMPAPLALARRVTENDVEGAIDVLQRAGVDVPATALSAKTWIELGRSCVEREKNALALLALRKAVEVAPEGPLAPQAWLQAARIYDEKLGNRTLSNQLLAELIKRHPGSAEAQFALRRLET